MFLPCSVNAAPETGFQTIRSSKTNKDLQLIRNAVKTFTQAFNNADANAVAAHFAQNADYIGEDGTRISGRTEIRKDFESIFQNSEPRTLNLKILSIRMITPTVAIEDGMTIMNPAPPGPPVDRRYTVVHVKQNDKWLIKSVRESRSEKISNNEKLKELGWLVGEWIDESPDSIVHTTCKWSSNKNYLLRKYTIQFEGRKVFNGVQRIGWDPLTKRIKSWVFDSEGTVGEGYWTRDGNGWIVSVSVVLSDGRTASAKNTFEYLNKDSFIWSSTNRVVDGISTPDILNVKIVKKPPLPGSN
jgi:uncharacterized protein (TIGR02246 family)